MTKNMLTIYMNGSSLDIQKCRNSEEKKPKCNAFYLLNYMINNILNPNIFVQSSPYLYKMTVVTIVTGYEAII